MKHLFLFLLYIGISIISTLFGGCVLSCMWTWFIIPVFTSAPHLDYLHAVGVNFIISFPLVFMTSKMMESKGREEPWSKLFGAITMLMVAHAFLLLSAFGWHQFIR